MKSAFLASFERDLRKIKATAVLGRIRRAILQIEQVDSPAEVNQLEKLSGTENYFRLRVGDFRIGLIIHERTATFVRCLHRREIYRHFP